MSKLLFLPFYGAVIKLLLPERSLKVNRMWKRWRGQLSAAGWLFERKWKQGAEGKAQKGVSTPPPAGRRRRQNTELSGSARSPCSPRPRARGGVRLRSDPADHRQVINVRATLNPEGDVGPARARGKGAGARVSWRWCVRIPPSCIERDQIR